MARGLFITGTGTGVGKTYVAALIARALFAAGKRVGVYKPVASDCPVRDGELVSTDAITLWEAAGRPGSLEQVCPQRFAAPLAPHLAARAEGRRVDRNMLWDGIAVWRETCEIVLVEGAGGLMSPLSDDDYNADLAADFGYPLIVVSANVLGTINATLQTLITASTYGKKGTFYLSENRTKAQSTSDKVECPLFVPGIVLNSPAPQSQDASMDSNRDELERRCVARVLAAVNYGGGLDCAVDWWEIAGSREQRAKSGV
jgi:dethiobiotin synthetase